MKRFILFILACCTLQAYGNPVFDKLNTLNKCWSEQKDIAFSDLPSTGPSTEQDWIRLHLAIVEKALRARSTEHLTKEQKHNRLQALDILHDYMLAGAFPQNEKYPYRTPIFIDDHDNFCAVGYLVKATGYEAVSRKISAQTNLAYVKDMRYPELFAWAKKYGFTVDELAWIQPSYSQPPWSHLVQMGKGTNGNVTELYVDSTTQRLYVGGTFSTVDSTIPASNIAYVTESSGIYTWHSMGQGLNGVVHAVERYDNKIFAGGSFNMSGSTSVSNIAYWDGITWNSAGCLNGTVKDLLVFNNTLYACGQFGVCSPSTNVNFAKWNGNSWIAIPGLEGKINTMEQYDTMLVLGGAFSYAADSVNIIKWNSNGFATFNNRIRNEVNDIALYRDSLRAICRRTHATDMSRFKTLNGNSWDSVVAFQDGNINNKTYNTICSIGDTVIVGGELYGQLPGYYMYNNSIGFGDLGLNDWFQVDSTVNKMVVFKGLMIAGGNFKYSYTDPIPRNGIGYRKYESKLFPLNTSFFNVKSSCINSNTGYCYANISGGKMPYKYQWSTGDTTIYLQNVPPGNYTLITTDKYSNKDTATVIIASTYVDKNIFYAMGTLYSMSSNAEFQWLNCDDNNAPIPGATQNTFKPGQDGSYALAIKMNGCADTTACLNVVVTGIKGINNTGLAVYPNPITDELNISFAEKIDRAIISIADMSGRTILVTEIANANKTKLNTASLPSGVYTLHVKDSKGNNYYQKITK